ncbi:conserved hypothetical protein [Vibrio phage 193E37-1]|nr:conserved hypothetical protein [Vibrio phage 193E37-1]
MNKWVKVESEFLSDALFERMRTAGLDIDETSRGKVVSHKYGVVVHSFTQINKNEMIICWEGFNCRGERVMMNTKVKEYWWE